MEIVDKAKFVGKLDPVKVMFSYPSKFSVSVGSIIVIVSMVQAIVVYPPYVAEFGILPRMWLT
jgi:hypothetical protein